MIGSLTVPGLGFSFSDISDILASESTIVNLMRDSGDDLLDTTIDHLIAILIIILSKKRKMSKNANYGDKTLLRKLLGKLI